MNSVIAEADGVAPLRPFPGRESIGRFAGLPHGHLAYPPLVGQPYSTAGNFVHAYYVSHGTKTLCYWQGGFFAYAEGAWLPRAKDDVRADVYRYIKHAAEPTRAFVDGVMDALRAVAKLPDSISPPAWTDHTKDDPRDVVAFRNGLLRITDGTLLPATPRFFTLNTLDFAYEPAVRDPVVWLGLMKSIWPDDLRSIEALQEWFGYLLTLDTRQQKALLIVGPKRSGKGTIARILRMLVGAANVSAPTLASLGQQFGLQDLVGKQLAIISDARLGGRADAAAVAENLLRISGEDAISVARKFQPDYTAQLPVRFVVMTNELPSLADASGALASRFILLRMTRSFFGKEDHGLLDRLLPELPAILHWALEGLQRLRGRGYFLQPESGRSMLDDLEAMSSPVKAFVADRCILDPRATMPIANLYGAWIGWCAEQGRDAVGTSQSFGAKITSAFPTLRVTQPRLDGVRTRVYEGVRLRVAGDA
jgi:putative DNA primase/helicase